MMTSFSVLREVSLLAGLNGALWWPRYGSQSSQCTACEVVFNKIISLRSPQVVDWIEVFARSCFSAHFNVFCVSLFFWNLAFFFYLHVLCILVVLPRQTREWACLKAGRRPKDRRPPSLLKCRRISIFFFLPPASIIRRLSPFSVTLHYTRLYETVFNLNIRLPGPAPDAWMATEDRVLSFLWLLFFLSVQNENWNFLHQE